MTLDEIIKRDRKSNNKFGGARGRGGLRGNRGRDVGRFKSRPNAIFKRREDRFQRGGRAIRGSRNFNTVSGF